MLTIHTIQTENSVTIPKEEFLKLVEILKKLEKVKICENDLDYLRQYSMNKLEKMWSNESDEVWNEYLKAG